MTAAHCRLVHDRPFALPSMPRRATGRGTPWRGPRHVQRSVDRQFLRMDALLSRARRRGGHVLDFAFRSRPDRTGSLTGDPWHPSPVRRRHPSGGLARDGDFVPEPAVEVEVVTAGLPGRAVADVGVEGMPVVGGLELAARAGDGAE